jgi:hypothetical protein
MVGPPEIGLGDLTPTELARPNTALGGLRFNASIHLGAASRFASVGFANIELHESRRIRKMGAPIASSALGPTAG